MREFKTEYELRKFLSPVLRLRVESLKKDGITTNSEILFKKLKENKWKNSSNLHLCDMVEDILHENIEK